MSRLNNDPNFFLVFVVAMLVAVFAVLWWRRGGARRKGSEATERWILIDGSNVMHWREGEPDLGTVKTVVTQLIALGYAPGVVFDANAGWKLQGRYLHDQEFARLLALPKRQVLVVGKGTQADPFLLQTARAFGARIVTNDRFRDWATDYPEVLEPGFLIRGGMRDGRLWLQGVAVEEGAL